MEAQCAIHETKNGMPKTISNVRFEPYTSSDFVQPTRMFYERAGRQHAWDMAMEKESVSVLLYHTTKKKILLVKQFRPPIFVHNIMRLDENKEKSLSSIEWGQYPISTGETIELCAGIVDKKGLSYIEHAREEIFEECGYDVPLDKIHLIKKYVTGISLSGTSQHLYYAMIDDSMKVNEGGGNSSEGEYIEKVFFDLAEAKKLIEGDELSVLAPPSLLFAISWFLSNADRLSL